MSDTKLRILVVQNKNKFLLQKSNISYALKI